MSPTVFSGQNQVPIKAWIDGVPIEREAEVQLRKLAQLPIIHKWVAVMPDVHLGIGATVGSVVPTVKAIIPAAVGVDLGCGMIAVQTSLTASDLPDNLKSIRTAIEKAVPHGRSGSGGSNDKGSWRDHAPARVETQWRALRDEYEAIRARDPHVSHAQAMSQLGTLGTGNHFVELCVDEVQNVWLMLHSGSRGVGNKIGTYFIDKARREMEKWSIHLPDRDLAYLPEGSEHFDAYVRAVKWAQDYARTSRDLMMASALDALKKSGDVPAFTTTGAAVNCHHNYVAKETHFGESVWVTRKGAVRAGEGDLGIIPGSMGARSYIVRGKGNADSFHSCSHGAGRSMSRTQAKKQFTLEDHARATAGIECRKDADVIDETPMAYKSIEAVMAAQRDLVDVVHELRQVLCVKG